MNMRWHLALAACAAWGLLGCGGGGDGGGGGGGGGSGSFFVSVSLPDTGPRHVVPV